MSPHLHRKCLAQCLVRIWVVSYKQGTTTLWHEFPWMPTKNINCSFAEKTRCGRSIEGKVMSKGYPSFPWTCLPLPMYGSRIYINPEPDHFAPLLLLLLVQTNIPSDLETSKSLITGLPTLPFPGDSLFPTAPEQSPYGADQLKSLTRSGASMARFLMLVKANILSNPF